MNLKDVIQKYLEQMHVMHLATVKDGKPRLCSVHYAPSSDGNLYWVSSRNAQHSEDVRNNKITAAAILINEETRQCIHFEGEAFELSGDEITKADAIYGKRYGVNKERLEAVLKVKKENPAYYVFKPMHITLIDTVLFPDNPKQELALHQK